MKRRFLFSLLSLVTFLLIWFSKDHILFWDTVQFAGKHGLFFYEHGFSSGLLPPELDSGHPPFFGLYLASLWHLFGKSLAISHFALLPFLLLNLKYAIALGRLFLAKKYWLFPVSMMICPFYLGHSTLVSPDIILVSGFLMALYGILSLRLWPLFIGSLILSIISMRGFIVLTSLSLFHIIYLYKRGEGLVKVLKEVTKIYLCPFLIFLLYQVWHYIKRDWIGFHDDSPWAPSFNKSTVWGWIRNSLVFGWRLCDYGMGIAYLILAFWVKRVIAERYKLGILIIILIIIMYFVIVPFAGLLNHRYFLPIQLSVLLLVLSVLCQKVNKLTNGFIAILFLSLVMGNFWIYPSKYAQGWDSTAAHWSFYKIEKEMHQYIKYQKHINASKVGTDFPLVVPRKFLDLSTDTSQYLSYDLEKQEYILWSNIMNGFNDKELDSLATWIPIKTIKRRGIYMILYQRD